MDSKVILKTQDLSVYFGDNRILNNINLSVHSSEILGVVGVSGSGKTTLLLSLLGLVKPSSGTVLFSHKRKKDYVFKPVNEHLDYFRSHVGFSSQHPSFYTKLTIKENLSFFGNMMLVGKGLLQQRINVLLDLFELKQHRDKLAEELSGGMQKRLDMAISIVHNPLILLLDEPTGELDPLLRKEIWFLTKRINEKGKTVILCSHFINDLEQVCDRIAVLHEGNLITVGTPAEIRERISLYDQVVVESVPGNYDKIISQAYKDKHIKIRKHIKQMNYLIFLVENGHDSLKRFISILDSNKEKIIDVRLRKPPLEEMFELI
ncbi:MAG TPA: ABC transporter ATP-binding protein [Candidatus Woesearchaeota archaeon]|nr:ABC transporter ATP-binding protein [Candidatus Woesearchaeota archaeon]